MLFRAAHDAQPFEGCVTLGWCAQIKALNWLVASLGYTDIKKPSQFWLGIMRGRWPHETSRSGLVEADRDMTDDEIENFQGIRD